MAQDKNNKSKRGSSKSGRKQARGKTARKIQTPQTPDEYAVDQLAYGRAAKEAEEAELVGASRRGEEKKEEKKEETKEQKKRSRKKPEKVVEEVAQAAQVEEVEKASKADPKKVKEAVVADVVEESSQAGRIEKRAMLDPLPYGKKWLEGVFERMNFDVEVRAKIVDDRILFDASGPDADYLLGIGTSAPKSIEAIQTLLGAALDNQGEDREVVLDVKGWRDQQTGRLESVAAELAETAKQLGKSVTIAGFNSHERSVVHNVVKEKSGQRTESKGDGIFRKVTIFPSS